MKKRIRLTENDLHRVIKESVKKVLRENDVMEKWYAVYVMSDSDLERMDDIYADKSEEDPYFVELTLVKSTNEEQAGWQGAWKLEDKYRCGKLVPIRTRIATQKDFDLWKNGQRHFEYDEFMKLG
jgi:hypothetical protein